ncbi:MAG: glycosyltransferase family 2 protein, partial [bacterium]|nr:glycosyltransferase family 2 protein [bacterium]
MGVCLRFGALSISSSSSSHHPWRSRVADTSEIELSIVMPCLNEADTLETCIEKAKGTIARHAINAEIIVADNGSEDGSIEIAERLGARVVPVEERGYGAALMGGIDAARGRFVIMGDADDSYDFSAIYPFVERLRAGAELVVGCRLPSGGGSVAAGAMPPTHRWFGNPLFSWLARRWFRMPTHDVYCGLRGFTKELYGQLELRCLGMEFATEMIIKSSLFGRRIEEVPITLHPDGRLSHPPHLRTISDGLRTLRFFLLYCPRWLFLVPGAMLIAFGLLSFALILPGPLEVFGSVNLDVHTLLVGGAAWILGNQLLVFGLFTHLFAMTEGLVPRHEGTMRFGLEIFPKLGFRAGLVCAVFGLLLLAYAIVAWGRTGFGDLDYPTTMRVVIPSVTIMTIGIETGFSSLFVGILGLRR